jgi:hypothetical protein
MYKMSLSVYEKILSDYVYMESVLDHVENVDPFRQEIMQFQQLCLIYLTIYDDTLYGNFLVLLQKLMDKMN